MTRRHPGERRGQEGSSNVPSPGRRSVSISRRRDNRPAQCQIASRHECGQAPLERPTIEKDVPLAALAAQAYVRPEPVYEPIVAAARVRPTQSNDVPEPEFDDGPVNGWH